MKKLMMLIMVIGLAVFAADGTGFSSNNNTADNIAVVTPSDIAPCTQSDEGPVGIVYLEITDVGRPRPDAASAQADVIHQLPDATTLVFLGLGGLLYRRRKE